ncbi:MAG: glycosyl transferase [Anaerolineae bacterium]|nr:glycosyl transferase [Gloeobacterales cyanobacterium ES-bin-313]
MLRKILKGVGIGRVAYWAYYAPAGVIKKYIERDPFSRFNDEIARKEMEASVFDLQPFQWIDSQPSYEVFFLTGKRFWYQTCFCAYSMAKYSDANLCPIIYDDGTLGTIHITEIKRIFPNAQIILIDEIEETVHSLLPESRFPVLHERRRKYPNIRKLIDIHIGSTGWKLVLDSDMLFFGKPDLLLEWLANPDRPCHMIDVETSYGYSNSLMTDLAQSPIPERLNVGICGLNSSALDWEQLEYWCHTMIEREGTNYYQEQALVAMLMAGQDRTVAPSLEYITLPQRSEVLKPLAVLHHYVSDSKPWYFRYGWRQSLQSSSVR